MIISDFLGPRLDKYFNNCRLYPGLNIRSVYDRQKLQSIILRVNQLQMTGASLLYFEISEQRNETDGI